MRSVVLILPTGTYRAPDFVDAARALDAEVIVASEERQALEGVMGDRSLAIDLCAPDAAADAIVDLATRRRVDAVIAVDDQGVVAAALAAKRLGFPHNAPDAVARTRDKAAMRHAFDAAGIPQPAWGRYPADVGYPCVVKPLSLSASRGVIRADDAAAAARAATRIRAMLGGDAPLLAERFVPGAEVAIEGLLRDGELTILAIFDKPDPLDGPYFEETIYVTPSRLPREVRDTITTLTARAARALGLTEGPIHAEARVDGDHVTMLELAARSIGGLCARTLRFGMGISLEEVILRHALGLPLGRLAKLGGASGVMMLPIPARGTLARVEGVDAARAVPNVEGVEITIPVGGYVEPLPEGDRYLGFVFARADTPDEVESALRQAHAALEIEIT